MKRITLFTLILVTLALLLSGCMDRGNVNHVHKTLEKSTVYTEAEIKQAMDIVTSHFRQNFEGCTLIHLAFYEDTRAQYSESWAKQYNADEAIILVSSFEVGPEGSNGSLNPDSTYNGWQWILTRDKGGSWALQTWGYG